MKHLFLSLSLLAGVSAVAQKTPVAKKPVPKTTTVSALKTMNDSVSYAAGLSVANFYKQQGIAKLNSALVAKAINDVGLNKKSLLSDADANDVMMRCINQVQQEKTGPTVREGEQFLAQNKTKPGVKTTPSGLQYEVLTQGSGPMPTASDTVVCNYRGTLLNGTEFDNSYKRGEPITFPLSGVIQGWTEALQLMPVGSKYKLYVPQQLGYGLNGNGAIPGGSTLVFEVELLSINGK